jgi:hypothetical protein
LCEYALKVVAYMNSKSALHTEIEKWDFNEKVMYINHWVYLLYKIYYNDLYIKPVYICVNFQKQIHERVHIHFVSTKLKMQIRLKDHL